MEMKIKLPIGTLVIEVAEDGIDGSTILELARQVKPFVNAEGLIKSVKGKGHRLDPSLREKAISLLKKHGKPSEIARQLNIPATTIYGIKQSINK